MPESESRADRATALIMVATSGVAFSVAFNFGAFDQIFFDRLFALWVLATAVLIASFVTSVGPKQPWARLALLLPSFWLVLESLTVTETLSFDDDFIDWLALIITVIALPVLAYAVVGAINPAFLELPDRNRRIIVISIIVFTAAGAFMGVRNDLFVTCEDFKVSGNDQPENCRIETGQGP